MAVKAWESGLVLLLVFGRLTWAKPVRVPVAPLCAAKSVGELVLLGLGETSRCPKNGYESVQSVDSVRVTEAKLKEKSSTSASAAIDDTLTAYEVLEEYDFPIGLLPQGITGYELDKSTGEFSAYLNSTCTFTISGYELKYKTTITGVITSGKLYKLSGISVKVLFLWLNIAEVIRDDDDDDEEEELEFSVGIASADFPVNGFDERPRCGCGFDCGDVSRGITRSRGAIFNLYRVLSDLLD